VFIERINMTIVIGSQGWLPIISGRKAQACLDRETFRCIYSELREEGKH
jgi:hypothetical protein